jgi:hypothetical protein
VGIDVKAKLNDIECNVITFDEETQEYLLEHDGFTGWFNYDHPGLVIIRCD